LSRKLLRVLIWAGLGAALMAVSRAGAGTGPAMIRITDLQTGYTQVDVGTRRISAGDLMIIHQSLFNRRVSSASIGRANILCTRLSKTRSQCNGTYQLPKGSIVTSGEIGTRLLYEVAIVGGTELYDNARGSLVVTTTSLKPRREVLVFRLTG
jgi:hypothetical protein